MAKYTDAIEWIAFNDEPTRTSIYEIAELISVQLIADIFHKGTTRVAGDVQIKRKYMQINEED